MADRIRRGEIERFAGRGGSARGRDGDRQERSPNGGTRP
ncbi:MAG: hypothetical protein AVDCRST_MAG88-981 [uncultured Thermomicrobiales bacterium]|uniref:Uncharacterized protein n=1 Tax=uncultured Thermomicrobiales bacterium TaxID=1645740 RepID=A0A6J4ULU6_9BACT|nr:MAG: hypothetical protein AVDCRST_MAG88-981 [uncultured Thermomicrobiales bacterium]